MSLRRVVENLHRRLMRSATAPNDSVFPGRGLSTRKQRLASKSIAETATAFHQLLQTLMPAAQGPPKLQVGGRGRKVQVAFLRLLKSPRLADEPAGRVLRSVRSSKVEKPSKLKSPTTKSRRKQNHRSVRPW
jgi:hypothetical protein